MLLLLLLLCYYVKSGSATQWSMSITNKGNIAQNKIISSWRIDTSQLCNVAQKYHSLWYILRNVTSAFLSSFQQRLHEQAKHLKLTDRGHLFITVWCTSQINWNNDNAVLNSCILIKPSTITGSHLASVKGEWVSYKSQHLAVMTQAENINITLNKNWCSKLNTTRQWQHEEGNGGEAAMTTTTMTTTTTTILRQLYRRPTCISHYPQLSTGRFCWSKVLLPACRCCWQQVHRKTSHQWCYPHCLRTINNTLNNK